MVVAAVDVQITAAGTRIATSTATSTAAAVGTTNRRPPPRPVTGEMMDVIRIFGSAVATTAVLLIGAMTPGERVGVGLEQGPAVQIITNGIMEVQR